MVSTRTLPSRRPTSSQELRTNSRSTSLSWNTLISRAVNAARNHHWRAKSVQKMEEHKAHRCGIRIRRVCAWNTSKLAFDGTGVVTRDTNNYSMCTFQTGKRYSCDLSASYNIGARYFLREYEKSISVTKWRRISAKVPGCAKRVTRTLDTLIRVCAELRSM